MSALDILPAQINILKKLAEDMGVNMKEVTRRCEENMKELTGESDEGHDEEDGKGFPLPPITDEYTTIIDTLVDKWLKTSLPQLGRRL